MISGPMPSPCATVMGTLVGIDEASFDYIEEVRNRAVQSAFRAATLSKMVTQS